MDLRAMLIEARGERRAGDMVHLRVAEVDALIERLTPARSGVVHTREVGGFDNLTTDTLNATTFYESTAAFVAATDEAIAATKPATKTRRAK